MAQQESTWTIEDIEPTTLVVAWPHHDPPSAAEIEAALRSCAPGGAEQIDELEHDDPNVLWNIVMRLGGRPTPVIVWTERAREGAFATWDEAEEDLAPGCRWVVGFESPLDSDAPIEDYGMLLRAIARALADSPAALEPNTTRLLSRRELDQFFGASEIDPPASMLWTIHAIAADADSTLPTEDAEPLVWLHTHGLSRCGLPELELLEIPARLCDAGAELVQAVAEMLFERDLPEPGEPFSIGPELEIAVQPWREVVEYLPPEAPGRMEHRIHEDGAVDEAHGGVRAAIVAPQPRGAYRELWTPPLEALETLAHGSAIIYRPSRLTERQAQLARETWPEFAMAFAQLDRTGRIGPAEDRAVFAVKVGFNQDGSVVRGDQHEDSAAMGDDDDAAAQPSQEHLWFEVRSIAGDSATAALLNSPRFVESMREGDVITIHREALSDWIVRTPHGLFEPDTRAALWQAVEAMQGGQVAPARP